MKETKFDMARVYLFGSGVLKKNIERGLRSMGQKTLLKALV
jgi:hypothetical protein